MKRILIIDDEEPVRNILVSALRAKGFYPLSAANGQIGINLAKAFQPDLIISDINMEGVDGYELIRVLRQDALTSAIPIVLMTGKPDFKGMRDGMTLGADDYLPKPFSIDELLATIASIFQKEQTRTQAVDQKMRTLTANISMILPHELLTPLNGILGIAQVLRYEGPAMSGDQITEFGKMLEESGTRLQRTIKNFIIYAQIEVMTSDPQRRNQIPQGVTEHLSELIHEISNSIAAKYKRQDDLQLTVQPAIAAIPEEYTTKILEEIIDNAFKFSKPGTPVKVVVELDSDFSIIKVIDKGCGIMPKYLENIGAYMQFERKIMEQQGTGFGLIISKRLTELYNGRFEIKSQPAEGTEVIIKLPKSLTINSSRNTNQAETQN
jgi:signal transduction histidine kinase